ncbi:hypothetical protein GCK72_012478 [Caenorhabditis remanei]|uniref:Sdz-33 F-box domain-containing protein n=1 Tax=Caenorhabditis remanei TaxID=31234 RepID=A0A6A5GN92_CAERE|nr:hypothetical protein GCK72_012478 [Caenorhabditis remanei]KAF1756025.1 hypothetical protein GCK72_012478 [Caenorhabditis remanei]
MNAREIRINKYWKFAPKDLNRFLKLWMNGSNGRLGQLDIDVDKGSVIDKDILFKGIKYSMGLEEEEMYSI